MEEMGDVILIIICPKACNPIENIAHGTSPLSRLFQDYSSKYRTAQLRGTKNKEHQRKCYV